MGTSKGVSFDFTFDEPAVARKPKLSSQRKRSPKKDADDVADEIEEKQRAADERREEQERLRRKQARARERKLRKAQERAAEIKAQREEEGIDSSEGRGSKKRSENVHYGNIDDLIIPTAR